MIDVYVETNKSRETRDEQIDRVSKINMQA